MNYLIIEILGCLVVAAIIGVVLGWFLRGGCKTQLQHNSLDWQEKLRIDNLTSKNKISVMEEKYRHQLQTKDELCKMKINQLNRNREEEGSDAFQNKIKELEKKLQIFELEQKKNEDEWSLVLEDVELGLKNKLLGNKKSNNRLNQENIFLKNELDRSVSQLNVAEKESKLKDQSLILLNTQLIMLEEDLEESKHHYEKKLQEVELGWVDKIEFLDEVSALKTIALEDCEKKLKVKSDFSTKDKIAPVKDNLKILRGIGTLIEKELNKLGVYTFLHVASWNDSQVLEFDNLLSLNGKIKKERWREQARKLIGLQ